MSRFTNLKNSVFFKALVIIFLILILLIPSSMVESLIHEREYRQNDAISEVSQKYGERQTITGPYITIPFDKFVKQRSGKEEKIVKIRDYAHFLPEHLNVNGKVVSSKRTRGIYEVVLYESKLNISGDFTPISFKNIETERQYIYLDKATLNVGISDLKGIEKQIDLNWNENSIVFNSGVSSEDIVGAGINANLPKESLTKLNKFNMDIDLKGSQMMHFIPMGKTTDVVLNSNWPKPSFSGEFLPDSREVKEDGFAAHWNILHLNRNFPQSWTGSNYSVNNTAFGFDLLLPVDKYTKSDRVAKYSILFLTLTFLVFFFVEVLNKSFIHPIQYLLVGIAIVVFYVLLLSFSEHINFNISYIVAALMTLLLIAGYVSAILKSRKLTMLIVGILTILYTFIFTIIQLEDYALLIGSIGVFLILAIVMYFSRKIDWYNV